MNAWEADSWERQSWGIGVCCSQLHCMETPWALNSPCSECPCFDLILITRHCFVRGALVNDDALRTLLFQRGLMVFVFLKEIQMTSYVVSLWFLYISCLGIQPSRGCFIKINTRIAWEDNFSYGLPYGVTLGHCFNYIHSSGKDPSTCGQQHSLGRRWLMVNYREKVSTGKQAYIPLSLLLVVDVISCLRLLPP